MIGSSIDTRAFSEVLHDDHFRAEPPQNTSLLISEAFDVVRSAGRTEVTPTQYSSDTEYVSAERTFGHIIERCRHDVSRHPKSHRSRLNLGSALLRAGDISAGIKELEYALELSATDYVALGSLAAAYLNSGETVRAEKLYATMVEHFPKYAGGYMGLATVALRSGRNEDALGRLQEVLAVDASHATASYLLAVVSFKLDNPKRAVHVLRDALRREPRSPELNQGMAIAYLLCGEEAKAEKSFRIALSLEPSFSSALRGLALLCLRQGRFDDAIELLLQHVREDGTDDESVEILAQAYIETGKYKHARSQLVKVLSRRPELPNTREDRARLLNNIGFCFAKEGSLNDAEQNLIEAARLAPVGMREPTENLARIYFTRGEFERSLKLIDSICGVDAHNQDMWLLKESCLLKLSRQDEAIAVLYRLVGLSNAKAVVFSELGWLLAEWREDFETAVLILNRGLDKYGDDLLIVNNLAYSHLMRGEVASAQALLSIIEARKDENPYTVATQGLLAIKKGNLAEGEDLYRKAEVLASRSGNSELVKAIRQKKSLEIARAYVKIDDFGKARRYLQIGLSEDQVGVTFPFRLQLEELSEDLKSLGDGQHES